MVKIVEVIGDYGVDTRYLDEETGFSIVERDAFGVHQVFMDADRYVFGIKPQMFNMNDIFLIFEEFVSIKEWEAFKAVGDDILKTLKRYLEEKRKEGETP